MLTMHDGSCPYCGEPISLAIDASAGAQTYIEDCAVCCRPITVVLDIDDDSVFRLYADAHGEFYRTGVCDEQGEIEPG